MAIELIKVPTGFKISQLLVEQPDPSLLKAFVSGTLTVEQVDSTKLKVRTRKILPAIADLDAIEDVIGQEIGAAAAANACTLLSTGVTAGKIWIVTSIIAYNNSGTVERIQISRLANAIPYMVNSKATLVKWQSVDFHGILVLDDGEKIQATFENCQGATDFCYLYYTGYQISKY